MNSCYASIELLHRPELRGKPMAVGGDPEARHGIVLAKDQLAKKAGVKTGMALWQARQLCSEIIFVPPRMDLYIRFSRLAREIYGEYSDLVEPFGLDESWIDVTASTSLLGSGRSIAEEIRNRIKIELGITVSIGVSWNKIFAKFGSDYKKPDAVTEITPENYQKIVWESPAEDLLYVGRATIGKLHRIGIRSIGEIALADPEILHRFLGKMGYILSAFARGQDETPVAKEGYEAPIKSIGNSTTTPRDLLTEEDVKIVLYVLAESVASRLREDNFKCRVVEISVRDNELFTFTRQNRIETPTDVSGEIAAEAMRLFHENYRFEKPVRSVGVRACSLVSATAPYQTTLFEDEELRRKQRIMDETADVLRGRFGFYSLQRGLMYTDGELSHVNAKEDHTVHPHGYFENGNQVGEELLKRMR